MIGSGIILLIIGFSIGIIGMFIARIWLWKVMREPQPLPPPRRSIRVPRRRSPAMPVFAHSPAPSTLTPDDDIELGDITNHSRASSTIIGSEGGSVIIIGPQLPPGLHVEHTATPEGTAGTASATEQDHRLEAE